VTSGAILLVTVPVLGEGNKNPSVTNVEDMVILLGTVHLKVASVTDVGNRATLLVIVRRVFRRVVWKPFWEPALSSRNAPVTLSCLY